MIDDRSIQRFLASKGKYTAAIDGDFGTRSNRAASEVLTEAAIDIAGWPPARCKLAVQQMMMLDAGIEVGTVDGLMGPQTRYALEQWQNLQRDTPPVEAAIAHMPVKWPRQSEVTTFYGPPGRSQVMLKLPFEMKLAWATGTKVGRFSVHEKVHDSAKRAFDKILAHYGPSQIDKLGLNLFGGCLNVRKMRGGNAWSMHSWGIAIDFDPEHNQLRWGRDRARMAKAEYKPFLDIWEAEGWISLGRERNYDWMHVQAARL